MSFQTHPSLIKRYFKNSHYLVKKVLILGYNDTAKKLANYFEELNGNISEDEAL